MKQIRFHKFQELATYCKGEGLDVDYFMTSNKIMNRRNPWLEDTRK